MLRFLPFSSLLDVLLPTEKAERAAGGKEKVSPVDCPDVRTGRGLSVDALKAWGTRRVLSSGAVKPCCPAASAAWDSADWMGPLPGFAPGHVWGSKKEIHHPCPPWMWGMVRPHGRPPVASCCCVFLFIHAFQFPFFVCVQKMDDLL